MSEMCIHGTQQTVKRHSELSSHSIIYAVVMAVTDVSPMDLLDVLVVLLAPLVFTLLYERISWADLLRIIANERHKKCTAFPSDWIPGSQKISDRMKKWTQNQVNWTMSSDWVEAGEGRESNESQLKPMRGNQRRRERKRVQWLEWVEWVANLEICLNKSGDNVYPF